MSHPSYFLGIDLGSSSVKTSLFDSDKGDTIDSITYPEKEMKIVSKKKGWAEQDPNYWWQCIEKCLITLKNRNNFDLVKYSSYKNQITILGNTPFLNDLIDKKRYMNLDLHKKAFSSKNTLYVNEFIKKNSLEKFDLIEIHNRPSYVHQISQNNIKIKTVLIFHNNPITLGGSKTLEERKALLNVCEKLIFVSNWVKERFFEGLEKKNHRKCIVVYPSVSPLSKFPKKRKYHFICWKIESF